MLIWLILLSLLSLEYQYPGIVQPGQAPAYPQFAPYPNATGDQNAQFLQGYALAQSNPAAVFGGPSFNQNPYPQGATAMSVPQLGAQLNAAGLGAGFPYSDYSQFNPYGQNPGVNIPAPMNGMLCSSIFTYQMCNNLASCYRMLLTNLLPEIFMKLLLRIRVWPVNLVDCIITI